MSNGQSDSSEGGIRGGCTSLMAWWMTYLVFAPVRMLYPAPDKMRADQKMPGFWFLTVTLGMFWAALFFLCLSATVVWLSSDASWTEGFVANAKRWWILLVGAWLALGLLGRPKSLAKGMEGAGAIRVHWFQHVDFEGLGRIAEWAKVRGHEVTRTQWFEPGVAPPNAESIDLLIVMGGAMGVHDEDEYPWLKEEKAWLRRYFASGKPVLGICLGAQILADALGAEVKANDETEIGWFPVTRSAEATDTLIEMFPDSFTPLHWHGQTFSIPEGAELFGSSEATANQGFAMDSRVLGLQFHLEMGPAEVEASIAGGHLGKDIADKYIQPANELQDGAKEHGARCRTLLYQSLDWLAVKAGETKQLTLG